MHRGVIIGALVLVCLGILLGMTVVGSDLAQATGVAQSVTVNNTAANPVPVAEQNLDTSGSIKVHEQGTVRDDHTNITFHAQADSGFDTDCGSNDIYTVPAGKQFVAEFVSIDSATGTSATTADQATLYNADQVGGIDFASLVLASGTLARWAGSQTIDLVFPSGATLGFNTQPDTATQCDAGITVGGYLQPTP
jgi:hypothetical protein